MAKLKHVNSNYQTIATKKQKKITKSGSVTLTLLLKKLYETIRKINF